MTDKELNALVKRFKSLVEKDINGITVSDARNTVWEWLCDIGQQQQAMTFQDKVYKYQNSKKIENMWSKA